MSRKYIALILLFFLFDQCCLSFDIDYDFFAPNSVVEANLNKNIQGIQKMVKYLEKGLKIENVDSSDVNVLKLWFTNRDYPITIYKIKESIYPDVPSISILPDGEDYYWVIGDSFLRDLNRRKIKVTDESLTPSFHYLDNRWNCKLGREYIFLESDQQPRKNISVITTTDDILLMTFPSSYQLSIPLSSMKLPEVPRKDFYKDLFLDAGIGLTSRKFLYAARYLSLSTEGISFSRSDASDEEIELQNSIIAGSEDDTNGRLLYPDGSPRYKLLFICGGSSTTHGKSLKAKARQNMKSFVLNGGSYVGTCAGAFFATSGYDENDDYPYYLSLWPSKMTHTGISNSYTGMFIDQRSPLLNYADFGGDYYISDIRHNSGGYPAENIPPGTEILARYDCPENNKVHMQPSAWAYKPDQISGRIIMEGSHPEEVSDGERRDFTASMMQYAMDGIGHTPLKGILQNGKTRIMNQDAEDEEPLFAKIGDLQCHHFAVIIPYNAHHISVVLETSTDCDLSLMLNKGSFAYPDDAEYISADGGAHQQLSFPFLETGLWYVTVMCRNTVDVTETEYGQSYIDNVGVLNGIPYRISVSWETPGNHNPQTSIEDIPDGSVEKNHNIFLYYGIDGRVYNTPQSHHFYIHGGKKIVINR